MPARPLQLTPLFVLALAACTVRFKPPPDLPPPPPRGEGEGEGDPGEQGEDPAGEGEAGAGDGGEGEGPCVPTLEVCDGVDDDCDGDVDEAEDGGPLQRSCYGGPPQTDGVGECHAGARVCEGGGYPEGGPCPNQVMPAAETGGDGLDQDCDGLVDEGFSSLLFDGRFDSRVTLPEDRSLALAETSFTIEAWVRPDELSYFRSNTIVSRRLDDGSEGWLFGIAGRGNFDGLAKRAPFFLIDGWPDDRPEDGRFLAAGSQYGLRDGVWAHLAVVFDLEGGEDGDHRLSLYVGGVLAASDDGWDRSPVDTPQIPEAWIGADQTVLANSFDGRIAEVRITAAPRYNQPFQPEACPADPADSPLAEQVRGHWRLSDASGAAALDSSPADLHGEISGVVEGERSRWQVGKACEARANQ